MPKETQNQVTAEQLAKAEALAKAAALKKGSLKARLANLKPEDIITNAVETEVLKRNQYESGGWLHSPAMLETFSATESDLHRCAEERGLNLDEIKRVRAAHIKSEKLTFIWPTTPDDPEGIEVNKYGSSLMINLITVHGPARRRVPVGYRHRYDAYYASNEESPFGAAIYLDLAKKREVRLEKGAAASTKTSTKKAKQSGTPAAPAEPTA